MFVVTMSHHQGCYSEQRKVFTEHFDTRCQRHDGCSSSDRRVVRLRENQKHEAFLSRYGSPGLGRIRCGETGEEEREAMCRWFSSMWKTPLRRAAAVIPQSGPPPCESPVQGKRVVRIRTASDKDVQGSDSAVPRLKLSPACRMWCVRSVCHAINLIV